MNRRAWIGLFALVLLALTGCSGIPDSSAPQVVRTVPSSSTSNPPQADIAPQPSDSPADTVDGFLKASLDAEAGHSTARQFLTINAGRRWLDNSTVILEGEPTAGDPQVSTDEESAQVQVRGRRIGQLDATGAFSPILKGMGTGDEESFDFHLTKVNGEWRIDDLPPGVLIGKPDIFGFDSAYHQYAVYFFDPQKVLVPDLRYTPLTGQALASWLLTQLLAGPRPELTQTLVSAAPAQAGKSSVQIGNPTVVEMPGAGQLQTGDRNYLATQLAFTLDQVPFSVGQLELTDSGKPVVIPQVKGVQFSKANLNSSAVSPPPGGALYFVRNGTVLGDDGKPASGQLGLPGHNFDSVALQRLASAQSLQVAALTAAGQLQIGTDQGLTPRRLPQRATSRPEWQSSDSVSSVWIGAGSHLYRVGTGTDGTVLPISLTSQVGPLPTGTITAVRLSPDGDRVALVFQGPNGVGNAWMGSVIASPSDLRVDSLEPLTPPALSVTDLAWADDKTLQLAAAEPGAEARVWQVYSDGSQLQRQPNTDLRGVLTAIAAQGQEIVVSAGGQLWKLTGESWVGFFGTGTSTPGVNPVFAS